MNGDAEGTSRPGIVRMRMLRRADALKRGAIEAQGAAERWSRDEACAAYFEGYVRCLVLLSDEDETDVRAWIEGGR